MLGRKRRSQGRDLWPPEACRCGDGGGGGWVVRAYFPLRVEQTERSYWKAESASDSSHPRPSLPRARAAWPPEGSRGRKPESCHGQGCSPRQPRKGEEQEPALFPCGMARAAEVLCSGQAAGGSAFLRPLTSPSPALECLGLKASHFPKGAFMRLSPQPWWLQEPRG